MLVLEAIFFALLATVIYAYVGYPLLVLLRGWIWRRPVRTAPIAPPISVVICAHNEEESIETKLQNVLASDYPAEKIEVIVASDGSDDATEAVVMRHVGPQVQLLCLPRMGKAAALNAAVAEATGDILVFSDANGMLAPDALRRIVEPLADDRVGGVAGNQVYRQAYDHGAADAGERGYWNFDRWMKSLQSRSGNTISATGSLYAIRRELFQPVPDGVTDDFVISTRVIEQGRRLVFAPGAICYEPVAGTATAEFGRKARVITRGFRGLIAMRRLLNPFRYGFYSLQLISHKLLRRLVAVPVLAIALISLLLWNAGPVYQLAAIVQASFYLAAAGGWIWSRGGRRVPKPLAVPFFFCMVNAAVLVALWNIVRGRQITLWNPHRGDSNPAQVSRADENNRAGAMLREVGVSS